MAEKPSYLKLLNGISCAETRAFQYLSAWADVTNFEQPSYPEDPVAAARAMLDNTGFGGG